LIGYLRLAGLPVFLYLAFDSGDGRSFAAAALYWLIAAGDYFDGFVARATGQYSRMGALLDPVVDRATVLSGAAVCWHFNLLPHWALAVLAVREVVTLVLAQMALRQGDEIEINWLGRIAVFAVMGAIFWTMVIDSEIWSILFVFGLGCALLSTALYIRGGLSRRRAR
jgi:cardiolipin synthase